MFKKWPRVSPLLFLVLSFEFACTKKPDLSSSPDPVGELTKGVVYFSSQPNLFAYDVENKKELFFTNTPYAGISSRMIYEDSIIYTGNSYGLTALDAQTGNTLWIYNAGILGYRQGSPNPLNALVMTDSIIYMTTLFGSTYDHPKIVAVNKLNGELIWSKDLSADAPNPEREITTPVVLHDRLIVMSHIEDLPDRLYCFNRFSGEKLWTINSPGAELGNSLMHSPDSSAVIAIHKNEAEFAAYNILDGSLKWKTGFRDRYCIDPQRVGNKFYLPSVKEAYVTVLNAENGQVSEMEFPFPFWVKKFSTDAIYTIGQSSELKKLDYNGREIWSRVLPTKQFRDSIAALYYSPNHAVNVKIGAINESDRYLIFYQLLSHYDYSAPARISSRLFVYDKLNGELISELEMPHDYRVDLLSSAYVENNKASYTRSFPWIYP